MIDVPGNLGERILLATRMAVMAHWDLKLRDLEIQTRQQLSSSGTAETEATDGPLPTATFGGAGSPPRRPSRLNARRSRR